jgi:hypothetical protein
MQLLLRDKNTQFMYWGVNIHKSLHDQIQVFSEKNGEEENINRNKYYAIAHIISYQSKNLKEDVENIIKDIDNGEKVVICLYKSELQYMTEARRKSIDTIINMCSNNENACIVYSVPAMGLKFNRIFKVS